MCHLSRRGVTSYLFFCHEHAPPRWLRGSAPHQNLCEDNPNSLSRPQFRTTSPCFAAAESIRVDNGPEFVSKSLDWWAYFNKVKLDFSRPGKPTDNAFIESFNGKFRNECLNQSIGS
ncbi:MAG: transposase family protein [Planctomycetes bacterium]|nr:transposase family protein [Planctomycetota bacterium]